MTSTALHSDWFSPPWHLESTYHVLCECSLSGFVYLTKGLIDWWSSGEGHSVDLNIQGKLEKNGDSLTSFWEGFT